MYKAILCRCKSCSKEKNYSVNTSDINKSVFCSYCNNKIGSIAEIIKLDEAAQTNREAEEREREKLQAIENEKARAFKSTKIKRKKIS